MAKNILVISCDIRETRAALIENGIIGHIRGHLASMQAAVGAGARA